MKVSEGIRLIERKARYKIWSSTYVSAMCGEEEMGKVLSGNGQTAGEQKSHRSPRLSAVQCVFLQNRRMKTYFHVIPCALLVGLKKKLVRK